MFKFNSHILLLITLVIVLSLPATGLAKAGPAPLGGQMGFTFADLGQNDMTITVIYDQEYIDFLMPEGRKINSAVLNLHLQHSTTLLADYSDIAIAVNDEPVANIILNEDNAAESTISVDLPLEALKSGDNDLLLRFNQRLVDNGCSDVGASSLWIKVFADSSIVFTSEETPEPMDLSQFPLPFSTFAALPGSPQITMIFPPLPTPAELSAAAQIAASLGQAGNWKNPPLAAYTFDQADQSRLAEDSLIVIDTARRNPLAANTSPGLTIVPSPYDPTQLMLVVSGTDDADLQRSVSMLTTRSYRSNLTGQHADPVDVTSQNMLIRATRSNFSELGLTTKRVRGIGLHDLYFPIDVPYDWKLTSEASVEVRFTHGGAITSASLMTLFINGFETANVRLDQNNRDNGRIVIQLSPRQVHPGRNWLHIVFDLHMTRENCKYRYFEEAWSEVSADQSLVNLAHVVSIAPLDLNYMPSFLVVPNDLSADLFVLPTLPSYADLTSMVRIAAKLGTYSAADTLHIQATTFGFFSLRETSVNVIVIGSPETNALIRIYDAQLPQPLIINNGQIVPAVGRELLPEEQNGKAAYLELLPSPWSRTGSLLVVSAQDPLLLLRLADILPTGGRNMKGQGNVAVVTETKVNTFTLGNLAGASLSPSSRKVAAAILIGAFVIIGVLGGVIVFQRSRSRS